MPKNTGEHKDRAPEWQSFKKFIESAAPGGPASPPRPIAGQLFHRDLSWLDFNDRVLNEAADETTPALERLRFATIVSSNLDEFFMVRVAELARRARQRPRDRGLQRVLSRIRDHVLRQKSLQAAIVKDLLLVLAKEGITIHSDFPENSELDKEIKARMPEMKFLIRSNNEALPPLMSERIHVFVRFPNDYAIISIEDRAARLIELESPPNTLRFALLERWVAARANALFPQREVVEAFPFKLIRDADLRYHPDDEETLEEQIVEAVEGRLRAKVIRLEVDASAYSDGALFLATNLGLNSAALYRFNLPLDLRTLATIYNMSVPARLKYPAIKPQMPPPFIKSKNIFETIKKQDILLHHPYDTFDAIVRFIHDAATDPAVTHIFHTMYRTSRESPIMEALKEAVKNGKKVTVYVEIRARFDELNNVRWADELRKAGARVIRPMGGYKVHCKMTQVYRQEDNEEMSYLHLGTGNYHPGTALQYTDLGLLTNDVQLGKEIRNYFSALTHHNKPSQLNELMVAPMNLHRQFIKLIEEETEFQRRGSKGHIIAKMNSLVDPAIISALYRASKAGVKIKLIVRGICSLRPGIKGLSENIRVISIVDRFLEHSRIYYFRANGTKKVYLSSADWMPRNFYTRYEIAFPVKDPVLKRFIREVILATSLHDTVKAWELNPDGDYQKVKSTAARPPLRSQFAFEQLALDKYANTVLAQR